MPLPRKRTALPGLETLMIVTLGLGLIGGVALDRVVTHAGEGTDGAMDCRLITEGWNLIQRFYVDRPAVQPRPLIYGAVSGMVDALGDTGHSRFLSPAMVKVFRQVERNKFQGIGAEIQSKDGHVIIVTPLDDSPAQRAGLRPGDVILRVNGRAVTGLPLDQVVEAISGPAGTSVTLTVLEPGTGRVRPVTVERAAIRIRNVTWQILPGTTTAHLRIAGFNTGVTAELHRALESIATNAVNGIVLDLRNNPGGLLDEAVGVASQFLSTGNVLLIRNARGRVKAVPVKSGGGATLLPLVTLVNGGTASGAEILAGALQDAGRAKLVGATTIGTGTVLEEFKLSDGSALLLAIEEWLTPAGHVIWHRGIQPNLEVKLAPGVSPLFPAAERALSADQLRDSPDTQLRRALALLPPTNSKLE